jgi:peptidoglycan/LPS O-acetylase OafA/YrhL
MEEPVRPAFAKRLAGIEGLRGLAAGSVLVAHVWNLSQPSGQAFEFGWLSKYVLPQLANGVTLFFALSGFLLYLPFASAALRGEPRPAFASYFRNRALRILPAYWFILVITSLVLQSARIHAGSGLGIGAITQPWLLLQNALLIQNYDPASISTGISPAWSLAVEVIFYAALPLLVLTGIRLASDAQSRGRRSLMLLAPAVIMGFIGIASAGFGPRLGGEESAASTWSGVWDASFLTHAHLFALGLALAVVRVNYQDGLLHLPRFWRPAAIVVMPLLTAAAVKLGVDGMIPERVEVSLIAIVCGLLLALVVIYRPRHQPSRLTAMLERPPLVGAGLVSYSVYLWHMPVILWLRKNDLTAASGGAAFLLNLATVAIITGLLSWLTYRYVEKPALRLKSRAKARDRPLGRVATS